MKIRIGDDWFDPQVNCGLPIAVVLTEQDKENIRNMDPDRTVYASFPDDFGDAEDMRAWAKETKSGF